MTYPVKTREMHSHHFDSTVWNDFAFRDDDVVIATYGKSGTTWVQQIVAQLIFQGAEDVPVSDLSPWLDLRIPPREVKYEALEAQTHRRFIKTHLPVDALVFSPRAKYIFVARDGRDVIWSMYNHHATANEDFYDALNNTPGLVGPPIGPPRDSVVEYFHEWLDRDGYPFWPFWENIRSWWDIRHLDNVMLIHFGELKADLVAGITRIANFLEINVPEEKREQVIRHCTFEYMKQHAELAAPLGGKMWNGGAQSFIHKGTNGRWKDMLSADESAKYENMAREQLGEACAHWLRTGERID